MAISHFIHAEARAAFERLYTQTLSSLWPVPYERIMVPTAFGSTHVIVSGSASAPPLLLLHAAGTSALLWHRQIAHLSEKRRVFALDIMGDIGLSAQTQALRTRADAARWLGEVLRGLGLARACFAGASLGGFLAANLAVNLPEHVEALALLAPAATLLPFKRAANLMIRAGSLLPMPFTVQPALRSMLRGQAPDPRFVELMQAGVRSFRYDREGVYPSELPDAELAALSCPVLLVLGSDELIYDPKAAAERAQRLIPKLELLMLTGHGHLPGVQSPDLVDARVVAFFDAHQSSSRSNVSSSE